MSERPRWIGDVASIAVIVGLFVAISMLPPDTSLSEIRAGGTLRACVPPEYPPLVTRDPARPGLEIEMLQEVASRMGVRLLLNTNTAMGRDFNPRAWRINRAQCHIIAGGVAATRTTRTFMDTTPPHLETGWVLITREDIPSSLQGNTVGFFAGLSGRDRLSLSRFLREQGATATIVSSADELVSGLQAGRFDAGATEAMLGRQIAGRNDWSVAWISDEANRDPLAFGIWKGDLTFKREVVAILADLQEEGLVDRLVEKYEIEPIVRSF